MPSNTEATFRNELVTDVAESFHTYLGKGISIPGPSSLNDGGPTPQPSLNVDDLEEVLRVHFLLSGINQSSFDEDNPRVIPFMRTLADRIRRLDVDVHTEREVSHGGIEGPVDWQATAELYRKQGYVNRTAYVTRRDEDELVITGNRVLRELLVTLQSIFENELAAAVDDPDDFQWLNPWLQADEGERLKPILDRTLAQNPVMRALERRQQQQPGIMGSVSLREIRSVKRTRKPIYREAAHLLERYRRVVDGREFSESEAREVLRDTYIRPDSETGSDLFELYWTFSLIEAFEDARLKPVTNSDDLIAEWQDIDSTYKLYRTNRTKGPLDFAVPLSTVETEVETAPGEPERYLPRMFAAEKHAAAYADTAFDISPDSNIWAGIPDIILYKLDQDSGALQKVLLGEVKYSANKSYLKQGIRELLEYAYLCSNSAGEYLSEKPYQQDRVDDRIEAVLFTKEVSGEVTDESLPISIVEHGSTYIPFDNTETE
jgi:hypothetical protein